MLSLLLMGMGLALSGNAEANTQAIFSQDGSQASVILMGSPGDPDPWGFWQALAVPEEDYQGKLAKKFFVEPGASGVRPFDAICAFSKMIQGTGSCTLIFRSADGLGLVDKGSGKARLLLSGDPAEKAAAGFHLPDSSNFVFRSRDGKLQISFVREEGKVSWFVVDWNGKGFL